MLQPIADMKERESILMTTSFMTSITDMILGNLGDYFDTVKEESQLLLVSMVERFLPPQLNVSQEQLDLVQLLKANISQWPNAMNGQLKDAATMEAGLLEYLFKNAVDFLSKTVTIFMDERSTRENLMKFFKLLNIAVPFMILNDYRIAKQTNALQRVDFLAGVIRKL